MMFFSSCHSGHSGYGGKLFSYPTHAIGSLSHHHLDELLVIDLAIPVDVCLADHLINLLICELLPEIGHHVAVLGRTDEAVAVAIKDLECFDQLLLCICILHLPCHQRQELWKIDRAVPVGVDFVDHVLQLSLCGILPKRPHHGAKLLGGDGSVTILVEQGERLLELCDLLLRELICHGGQGKLCSENPSQYGL